MSLTDAAALRALLERHGFSFSRALGQNFLTAAWVPERIAQSAGLGEDVGVLEIGPGVGCLTEQLARRAGRVLAVEKDESLRGVLSETLAGRENVQVLFADALKLDLAALAGEKLGGLRAVACANLPYNITSDAVAALLEARCFERITVMVQREAARRLCALPGDADYNASSVITRWYAQPEMLFDVPPDCFTPRPKVTSTVLSLVPHGTPPAAVQSEALLLRTVRAAFAQRRKTLCNALCAGLGLAKPAAEAALRVAGLDAQVRGEALGIAEFAALSNALFDTI